MEKRIKFSKVLQIGLLLTFFLPFFPKGCDSKKTEETSKTDSTIVANNTLKNDSNELTKGNTASDTLKTAIVESVADNKDQMKVSNEDGSLSTELSKKSTILKSLLRPNDNYTGVASLIDYFSLLRLGYGLGLAFILWLIALIVKLKDYNNIFNLLNITGLILLFETHSIFNIFNDTRLWGFWVCVFWSTGMIIYDSIVLIKIRKKPTKAN